MRSGMLLTHLRVVPQQRMEDGRGYADSSEPDVRHTVEQRIRPTCIPGDTLSGVQD
jgi:hypothetical protein